MKEFIVMTAIIPILMLFTMQFSMDFQRNEKIEIIQDIVYTAKETAKQEGRFSSRLRQDIISQISNRLAIPESRISCSATGTKKYRYSNDRLIDYRVTVEIDDVMAGAPLVGISEAENRFTYVIDSFTTSEYIGDF